MQKNSLIEWTGATWNPWMGCHRVSAGCALCYMFRDMPRYGRDPNKVVRAADATFNKPLQLEREVRNGVRRGQDRLVFTCSWSDWFIEEADVWRDEAWKIIRRSPGLIFQILTKRADRIKDHLPADWGLGYGNVWLGVTVENQDSIWRAQELQKVPAKIRFLSVEPMLGPVYINALTGYPHGDGYSFNPDKGGIHWVIYGGESGVREKTEKTPAARPFDIQWVREGLEQCRVACCVPFVKQLGTNPTDCGKPLFLSDKKGGDWDEWPAGLKVRRFPIKLK